MEKWITTSCGDLLNLKHVVSIEARPMKGQDAREYCQVVAITVNDRKIVIEDGFNERAEAQEAIAKIQQKLNNKRMTVQ